MTLTEFWNAFYDDTAPFFVNKFLEDGGDELLGETLWHDPTTSDKDFVKSDDGKETLSYRTYDAKMKIEDNPFADECLSHMNMLLIEKTDTNLVIVEIAETSGMMYADRFRVKSKWDIYSSDPRSHQVALRQSYAI